MNIKKILKNIAILGVIACAHLTSQAATWQRVDASKCYILRIAGTPDPTYSYPTDYFVGVGTVSGTYFSGIVLNRVVDVTLSSDIGQRQSIGLYTHPADTRYFYHTKVSNITVVSSAPCH